MESVENKSINDDNCKLQKKKKCCVSVGFIVPNKRLLKTANLQCYTDLDQPWLDMIKIYVYTDYD